jgi:hypothetical protein
MSRYLEAAALTSASMLALMTASMAQEAAAPTPEAPVSVARAPNDDIRLRQAVTVEGILEHERASSQIAKRNDGTRVSGSPGHEKSVDYVARLLKDKGYVTAHPRGSCSLG